MKEKIDIHLEIQTYFKNSTNEYKLLNVKVVNKHYHIFVKCFNNLHDPYWVGWQHFKNRGDRCSKCRYIDNGKKRLIFNEEKIREIVFNSNFELVKISTIGDSGKITVSSPEGYLLDTQVNNINRGKRHEFFHQRNPHTFNNIKLWCLINNKSYVLISEEYVKSDKNLTWKCNKCGGQFERSWNTTNHYSFDCPYCVGTQASEKNNLMLKNLELATQWNYGKNHPIRPEFVLPNLTKKVWWLCDNCNHEWMSSIHYRNQRNAPCPNCKMSKGEHRVKSFLVNNDIPYHYEHSFPNCKHIKNLRFDFYVPKYNLCIEYQGEFHFKVIEGISTINSFEKQQKCDKIKKDYCLEHNINFLEISYWDYNNINLILANNLKSNTSEYVL